MPYVRRRRYRRSSGPKSRFYARSRRYGKGRRVAKTSRRVVAPYRGRSGFGQKISTKRAFWQNPLVDRAYFKFVYHDTDFSLSTTVGDAYQSRYIFSGNSLFDPDHTGVGIQPYGFDQQTDQFVRYKVFASKIRVKFYTFEGAPHGHLTLWPQQSASTSYLEPNDLMRIRKAKHLDIVSDMSHPWTLSQYASTKSVYINYTLDQSAFVAAYNADPVNEWFWNIIFDTSGAATETNAAADVKITYYAQMIRYDDINES